MVDLMVLLGDFFRRVIDLDFVAKGTKLNYGGLILIYFVVLFVKTVIGFLWGSNGASDH